MDVCVFNILWVVGVFLSGKSGKPFSVDESFQRMEIGDKNIDPHIKLVAINEHGVTQISLHDDIVTVRDVGYVVNYSYTPASWFANRFHYPVVIGRADLVLMKFYGELCKLFR